MSRVGLLAEAHLFLLLLFFGGGRVTERGWPASAHTRSAALYMYRLGRTPAARASESTFTAAAGPSVFPINLRDKFGQATV